MDLLNIGKVRCLDMIRLMNRISGMAESRLPKMILCWVIVHGCVGWLGEVLDICKELEISSPIGSYMALYVYEMDVLEKRYLVSAREEWRVLAHSKAKLDTYVQVRDFTDPAVLVTQNLPRNQQSII